ncbi:MAG: GerW family sporulation protein [Nitrospiria bacterium]
MEHAEELARSLLDELKVIASTETIIGKPFQAGDSAIIPVSRVTMGIGVGGGGPNDQSRGVGGGGGVKIEPIAFLSVKGESISLLNIGRGKGLDAIYEKVPELVDKIVEEVSEKLRQRKKTRDENTPPRSQASDPENETA